MLKFSPKLGVKLGVSSLAILVLTACGGGGSDSSSPAPVAVNQAPVASAGSKLSIVTEGQPFTLDASGSTDANGDALSFEWRQTAGPVVQIASPTNPTLELVAPLLDADEALSFELTVSDGEFSRSSSVSLSVEDLKLVEAISEATEYGTGGPPMPVETVPDPSIFEGNRPIDRIIGLTTANEAGYRVHWAAGGGHDMPVSSQGFSVDGEKVGEQVDGVFLGGNRGTFERDGRVLNRFDFGITFATIQSDETLYNFNARLEISDTFTLGYTSHRGLVQDEIDGFGDEIIPRLDLTNNRIMGGSITAIGQDNIVLTLAERTTDDEDDEDAVVVMTSFVVDKFGQSAAHELGQFASNGTARLRNEMAATSYEDDNYLTAWAQNTEDSGYDIRLQRANEDGILFGEQTTVNQQTEGDQLSPRAVTMTDGNMLVSWLVLSESDEEERRQIRARIVRPDGSFVTDEVMLMPTLPTTDEETSFDQPFYGLTALNTNEVLLLWEDSTADGPEVRALVLDSEVNIVSNEIVLATGDAADSLSGVHAITLPDNRVIAGWHNDYPFNDERADTSHTIGFYPVGKE